MKIKAKMKYWKWHNSYYIQATWYKGEFLTLDITSCVGMIKPKEKLKEIIRRINAGNKEGK